MNFVKRFALAAAVSVISVASVFALNPEGHNSSLKDKRFILKAGAAFMHPHCKFGDEYSGSYDGLGVFVGGEFLLPIKLPIGVMAETTYTWGDTGSCERKMSSFAFLAGANYHFQVEGLDVYAGAKAGIRHNSIDIDEGGRGWWWDGANWVCDEKERGYKKRSGNNVAYGCQLGASCFFTDSFGMNFEIGYPTILGIAMALKF